PGVRGPRGPRPAGLPRRRAGRGRPRRAPAHARTARLRRADAALTPGAAAPLTTGSGSDVELAVSPPEHHPHADGRQQVADDDRRPRQPLEDALGEDHAHQQEAELEDGEEEHDAEAEARIPLRERQRAVAPHADNDEDATVPPRDPRHELERRRDGALVLDTRTAMEERGAQDGRRVERAASERIDEQEPEGDDRRADETGADALEVDRQGRGILTHHDRMGGTGPT